jgi:hypothetical protein
MPEQLDEEELADWRAGRNAVYQLATLTIGKAPCGRRRMSRASALPKRRIQGFWKIHVPWPLKEAVSLPGHDQPVSHG